MTTIETEATINEDGTLYLQLQMPKDITPGQHRILVVIEDKAAASTEVAEVVNANSNATIALSPLGFMVFDVGKWPENLSLRREDMYGNDGR